MQLVTSLLVIDGLAVMSFSNQQEQAVTPPHSHQGLPHALGINFITRDFPLLPADVAQTTKNRPHHSNGQLLMKHTSAKSKN